MTDIVIYNKYHVMRLTLRTHEICCLLTYKHTGKRIGTATRSEQ